MNCVSSPPPCPVSCVVSRTAPAPIIATDYTFSFGTDCLAACPAQERGAVAPLLSPTDALVVLVFCWVRRDRSEQPVGFVIESGCEIQCVRVSHIQRCGWE